MSKVKDLFKKEKFLVFTLILLCVFQLIYSFLFPAVGFSANWQPIQTYLPKFNIGNQDVFILDKLLPFVSAEFRLNSDVGHYVELAKDFGPEYLAGNNTLLAHPFYSFLIFLASLPFRYFIGSSYGVIFGWAILVNFILLSSAVILFFLLLKRIFSLRIAFLSSVLLIFSPLVHASLVQPRAEVFAIFAVTVSAWFLYSYIRKPSFLRLIVSSLIIGMFLLGKLFFAIPIFILLLAIYFKRFKEGLAFLTVYSVPFALWYFLVTLVWKIPFRFYEVQYYKGGTWLFNIFQWPWHQTAQVLLAAIPDFIEALVYSFLLIPAVLSLIGFGILPLKQKNIIYLSSIISVFLMSFLINVYHYRLTFLLFPLIYPASILGIEKIADFLKKYRFAYGITFYAVAVGFIIFISSLNFFRIFDYL